MFSELTFKQSMIALAFGALGALLSVGLLVGAWTLYVDHQRTTAMWIYVNQEIAAKQGAK